MEKKVVFPDILIKSMFNKDQQKQAEKQLEQHILKNIDNNNRKESLREMVKEYKTILFDPAKPYRQMIIKGNIAPVSEMLNIELGFDNDPETLFILIQPIIALFQELDWRIIVEYSNQISNFLKTQPTIILKFFNEIFEGLINLKIHQEGGVRDCGTVLDKILKETITNAFVDPNKIEPDFDIEKFYQQLSEKANINHPGLTLLIISWITVVEEIPQLRLFQFLVKILPLLFNMLSEKTTQVIDKASECLKTIRDGFDKKYEEYFASDPGLVEKILLSIISFCNSDCEKIKSFAFDWVTQILEKYTDLIQAYSCDKPSQQQLLHNSLPLKGSSANELDIKGLGKKEKTPQNQKVLYMPNSSVPKPPQFKGSINSIHNAIQSNLIFYKKKYDINFIKQIPHNLFPKLLDIILTQKGTEKMNESLKNIISLIPADTPGLDVKSLEEVVIKSIDSRKDSSIDLCLSWCDLLFKRFGDTAFNDMNYFIESFTKIFPDNNDKLLVSMITFLCDLGKSNEKYIQSVIDKITARFLENKTFLEKDGDKIIKLLTANLDVIKVYNQFADKLLQVKDTKFIYKMVDILNNFILTEPTAEDIKKALKKCRQESSKYFFKKIFFVWSYNPIAALILCFVAEYFELCFYLILEFMNVTLEENYYEKLVKIVQLIESPSFNSVRMKLLNPKENFYLVKSFYGIQMLLPQGQAFEVLYQRMKTMEPLLLMYDGPGDEVNEEKVIEEVKEYLDIFKNSQKEIE